jgi:hypothetical protein
MVVDSGIHSWPLLIKTYPMQHVIIMLQFIMLHYNLSLSLSLSLSHVQSITKQTLINMANIL